METPANRMVGIRNITGVACHLNSALQILFHSLSFNTKDAFVRLTEVLHYNSCHVVEGENCFIKAQLFVERFGLLLHDLDSHRESEAKPVNPQELYNLVSKDIDAHNIGDAGTACMVLLDTLRKSLEILIAQADSGQASLASFLLEQLNKEFWNGTLFHQIQGVRYQVLHPLKTVKKVIISRPIQQRPLPCPWILPTRRASESISSLIDSFQSLLSEQTIQGFQWDIQQDGTTIAESIIDVSDWSEDDESYHGSDDDSSSDSEKSSESSSSLGETFITTKFAGLGSLPQNIVLRLKRFDYKNDQVNIVSDPMNIPKILDVTKFMFQPSPYDLDAPSLAPVKYRLKGAIVFVNRDIGQSDDVGHYVTYLDVSANMSSDAGLSDASSRWVLFNDEKVISLDGVEEERILNLFSGRLRNSKDLVSVGFATVLLYQSLVNASF